MTHDSEPVTLTFTHRGKPITVRLVETSEEIDTVSFAIRPKPRPWYQRMSDWLRRRKATKSLPYVTGSIMGFLSLAGEVIGDLPDDWQVTDCYRFDSPEFSGLVRIRNSRSPGFLSQGPYSCPELNVRRDKGPLPASANW